jgi:hypothetical protein
MATLIRPNGTTEEATPANGKKFTLGEVQRLVGGDVQLLEVTPGIYGAIKVTALTRCLSFGTGNCTVCLSMGWPLRSTSIQRVIALSALL